MEEVRELSLDVQEVSDVIAVKDEVLKRYVVSESIDEALEAIIVEVAVTEI